MPKPSQVCREELPYRPTTGFRYEVLTDDSAVRKAVDDIVFDFYGEENPRQLEEYPKKLPKQGMTMGGMWSMDRKMVNFIREQYPPGTRIRLNSMDDPWHPIPPGMEGEVDFVDDEGQIFYEMGQWPRCRSPRRGQLHRAAAQADHPQAVYAPDRRPLRAKTSTVISTTAVHCLRAVSCAATRIRSRRHW